MKLNYLPKVTKLFLALFLFLLSSQLSYAQFKVLTDLTKDGDERELDFTFIKNVGDKLFVSTNSLFAGEPSSYSRLYEESLRVFNKNGSEVVLEAYFDDQAINDVVFFDDAYYWIGESEEGYALWSYTDGEDTPNIVALETVSVSKAYGDSRQLVVFDGKLFFAGENSDSQYGLYSYDGSSASLIPTTDDMLSIPYGFIVFDNKLYFSAQNEYYDDFVKLWSYDGVNHSELVQEFEFRGSSSDVFFESNNKLYCNYGVDLYVYDDIVGILEISEMRGTPSYATHNNKLFYCSWNLDTESYDLFSHDGVNEPTLVDLGIEIRGNLIEYNDKLYFRGENEEHGHELWSYDDVSNEVLLIEDIIIGAASSTPTWLTVFDDELFFEALNSDTKKSLFRYNEEYFVEMRADFIPKTEDTYLIDRDARAFNEEYVFDYGPGISSLDSNGNLELLNNQSLSSSSTSHDYVIFENNLYGVSDDDSSVDYVWRYNTQEGISVLTGFPDIEPDNEIRIIGSTDDNIYFRMNDGVHGSELWEYDGISEPKLLDVNPGSPSSSPGVKTLTDFQGSVYFSAYTNESGREIMVYDGESVPEVAFELSPGSEGENAYFLVVYKDKLYFEGRNEEFGSELWSYDGDSASLVLDIVEGPESSNPRPIVVGDYLYFRDYYGDGILLWQYDGVNDPFIVDSKFENLNMERVWGLTDFYGWLYFEMESEAHGSGLWRYDGINEPELITDIFEKNEGVDLLFKRSAGGYLYFQANDGIHGTEIWVSEKKGQQILFDEISSRQLSSEDFELNATVASGLNITYTSSDESVASISGNVVTIHTIGKTTITATQEGNDEYMKAAPINRILEVKEVLESDVKLIYPNPARDEFSIDIDADFLGIMNLRILNLDGSILLSKSYLKEMQNVSLTMDINTLGAGMYIVELRYDNEQTATQKIIKQ